MDEKLREDVAARLRRKESPSRIRTELIESGYAEHDIEDALRSRVQDHLDERETDDRRNSRLLSLREWFDRIGYGAASPQFINILFYQTGASLFLLGLINGLRTVTGLLMTAVLQEYAKVHRVSKNLIGAAGIVFGFSFLVMAFAIRSQMAWLFAIGILLAGIGVVTYGDLYNKFVLETVRREKMGGMLRRLGQYGILITMIAMLLSGWLIDSFPESGVFSFTLFGIPLTPVGYLLSFEITALTFILSSYILSFLKEQREERRYAFGRFLREHLSALRSHTRELAKNRYIALLLAATIITGLLEVLGQSYYGLFIYRSFKDVAFGGFLNVAVLYSIAIMTSFTGPWVTRKVQRAIGLAPMLVFGTLLAAILPFTLVYNANIAAVGLALIFSVMGAAIVGVAQGLLARKLMDEKTRQRYFMSLGLFVAVPYLILVPVGSWIVHAISASAGSVEAGMRVLFLAIGIGLVVIVMPIYFILVAMANKERL
jgi:MFS family permease